MKERRVLSSTYTAELLTEWPDMRLIIVPRHPERGKDVQALVTREGLSCILMSEIRAGRRPEGEVVVVDAIGELFSLYSLASVVYCGGSLVPKGGQNILEPAAWGKVVFYGPSMEDFIDEKNLLEEVGAGISVRNAEELLAGREKDALRSGGTQATRDGRSAPRPVEPRRIDAVCGDDHQGIRQQATGDRTEDRIEAEAPVMNHGRSSKPSSGSGLCLHII